MRHLKHILHLSSPKNISDAHLFSLPVLPTPLSLSLPKNNISSQTLKLHNAYYLYTNLKKIYVFSLWEFHMYKMYFDHDLSQFLSLTCLHSFPNFMSFSCLIAHWVWLVVFIHVWLWAHPLGHMQPSSSHIPEENWLSIAPQLGVGFHENLLYPCWSLNCLDLMQALCR